MGCQETDHYGDTVVLDTDAATGQVTPRLNAETQLLLETVEQFNVHGVKASPRILSRALRAKGMRTTAVGIACEAQNLYAKGLLRAQDTSGFSLDVAYYVSAERKKASELPEPLPEKFIRRAVQAVVDMKRPVTPTTVSDMLFAISKPVAPDEAHVWLEDLVDAGYLRREDTRNPWSQVRYVPRWDLRT